MGMFPQLLLGSFFNSLKSQEFFKEMVVYVIQYELVCLLELGILLLSITYKTILQLRISIKNMKLKRYEF